jgi:hypothetical protein
VLAIRRPTPTSFCDSLPKSVGVPLLALPAFRLALPALADRRDLPAAPALAPWEGLDGKSLLDWVMFVVPAIDC